MKYSLAVISLLLVFLFSLFAATDKDRPGIRIHLEDHARLGVMVKNPDRETLKERHLEGGAEIVKVLDGSVAEKIGLQEGDIITEFDGRPIDDPEDLKDALEEIEEEKTVKIVVNRDGKTRAFEALLKPGEPGEIHLDIDKDEIEALWPYIWWRGKRVVPNFHFYGSLAPGKGGFLGVKVQELSEQLKKYFAVDHGVLITEVLKDSPAEKAGLEAGDVILQIADKKIDDYSDLVRTLNFYDPGEKVRVVISRRGKEKTFQIELGKRKKTRTWKFKFNPDRPRQFNFYFDPDWEEKLEKMFDEQPHLLYRGTPRSERQLNQLALKTNP